MPGRAHRRFLLAFAALALLGGAAMLAFKTRPLGCAGYGWEAGTMMASCSVWTFGDYEQGAFLLGLEPGAVRAAAAAEILVLGYSHAHVGFSTPATRAAAQAAGAGLYNLSVSSVNSRYFDLLLPRIGARPRLVIVDADPFFVDPDPALRSGLERQFTEAPWRSFAHYLAKRGWEAAHRLACALGANPPCGTRFAFFRRRADGELVIDYRLALGDPLPSIPAVRGAPVAAGAIAEAAAQARGFLARHGLDPACTILTVVPSAHDNEALGAGIAAAIGAPWINPPMEGLSTVDGAHLDVPSAARWSAAFWAEAAPVLARCLGR